MDAETYIKENGLAYRWDGSYYVHDAVRQGQGDTLEAALAVFMGGIVDTRAALDAPLAAYCKSEVADADVVKAHADGVPVLVHEAGHMMTTTSTGA